jgi:hypothetical protein
LKPTARSIERFGARSGPSSTIEECGRFESEAELMEEIAVEQTRRETGAQARSGTMSQGAPVGRLTAAGFS